MRVTKEITDRVWGFLKEDEQLSLSLSLGHDKSSWEAGEIMDKSHYKYLEIKQRAERFFKLFSQVLSKHHSLIPVDADITPVFREYLEYLIIQRKPIKEATSLIKDFMFSSRTIRHEAIMREMEHLGKSNRMVDRDLFELVKEFDRWNNFRILPQEIQEPSAYKRRNKIRNLKHLRNITQLPPISIDLIIKRYTTTKNNPIFSVIVSEEFDKGFEILKVENSNKTKTELSRIGLFLFWSETDALEFGLIVKNYIFKGYKKPADGQKFWPVFRVMIQKALNYSELEKIDSSRKNMENAFAHVDIKYYNKKRKQLNRDMGDIMGLFNDK